MPTDISAHLIERLKLAHALEKESATLLQAGSRLIGDQEITAILRAHLMQTGEHERYVAERLAAHGAQPSRLRDVAAQVEALGLGAAVAALPQTPTKLVSAAYAFEHLEVATYRLLRRTAERAGDDETVAVAERILEQEEAAAELVASTFDRALELTLGEEPSSHVASVTPIGKPSEREPLAGAGRGPLGH